MEKSFLALKNHKAREAYVEAELVNGLAHQIRIIRQQRGWTQKQLASKLGTTPSTISRLEDPSYGRYTIQTLLALGRVFDVAFFVRYMPFSKFMPATWDTRPENFKAATYEDEASSVQFFTETKSRSFFKPVIVDTVTVNYTKQSPLEFLRYQCCLRMRLIQNMQAICRFSLPAIACRSETPIKINYKVLGD